MIESRSASSRGFMKAGVSRPACRAISYKRSWSITRLRISHGGIVRMNRFDSDSACMETRRRYWS